MSRDHSLLQLREATPNRAGHFNQRLARVSFRRLRASMPRIIGASVLVHGGHYSGRLTAAFGESFVWQKIASGAVPQFAHLNSHKPMPGMAGSATNITEAGERVLETASIEEPHEKFPLGVRVATIVGLCGGLWSIIAGLAGLALA